MIGYGGDYVFILILIFGLGFAFIGMPLIFALLR
jgi:hypothetical protein